MAYTPQVYDWRDSCTPIDQVFRAGGQSVMGGMTLGGFAAESPEIGGRGELVMNFSPFATNAANLDASWTISRIMNGAIMRVPLYQTVQLVGSDDLGGPETRGLTWGNGQKWGSGVYWAYRPTAPLTVAALRGTTGFAVDLSEFGPVLRIGHVIGFKSGAYEFAHEVSDIYYSGNVATVEITPPLRRDMPVGTGVQFRPKMMVTCRNAAEVMSNFTSGRYMAFNSARFVEALI